MIPIKKMHPELAAALIRAGIQHKDFGGFIGSALGDVGGFLGQTSKQFTPQNTYQAPVMNDPNAIGTGQAGLASTLTNEVNGTGPNPAQIQFQQNTNKNNAMSAGLINSQRGINPALAARMGAQTAASNNQTAAAQAAQLQAEQQLASQQQLGGLYGQMGAQNLGAEGINSGISGANTAATQKTMGSFTNAIGSALGAPGSSAPGGAPVNATPGGGGATAGGSGLQYGQGAGSGAAGFFGLAEGGKIPDHLKIVQQIYHPKMAHGGKVPVMVSPGEIYLKPDEAKKVATGEKSPMKGEKIPGKAPVKGDSIKNDIVSKKLDAGGVVIPREVLQSDDPEAAAHKFVADQFRKNKKPMEGEFRDALKRAVSGRKNK